MSDGRELDVLVVGGGVVGAGAALDAATRGLCTAIVEARDWASGTSSRSSKLIHGGLRYLEMLDFGLVREALQERGLMLHRLAPHLVHPVPFLYPLRHRGWERPYVGLGHPALRPDEPLRQVRPRRAAPPAPDPAPSPARGTVPAAGRPDRRGAVLGRSGRRRPAHGHDRAHGGRVRRARGQPNPGHRVPAAGRAGHRRDGRRPGDRRADRACGPSRSSTRPACGPTTPSSWPTRGGSSTCGRPRASTWWCPGTACSPGRG